ncbi:MAG: hypothetical protein J6T87_05660 [Bacteroidales bacterium]|nr:hypothetical protein [Bacteroidales bacterium]
MKKFYLFLCLFLMSICAWAQYVAPCDFHIRTEVIHGEVHSTAYKITYDCSEIQRVDIHSGYGISVRCVKEKD